MGGSEAETTVSVPYSLVNEVLFLQFLEKCLTLPFISTRPFYIKFWDLVLFLQGRVLAFMEQQHSAKASSRTANNGSTPLMTSHLRAACALLQSHKYSFS